MKSIYEKLPKHIEFPDFKNRPILYMHKIDLSDVKLPSSHQMYTRAITDALSQVRDRNSIGFITIDEKTVCNDTHRRSGIHVDFNWHENTVNHSGWGTHTKSDSDSDGGNHSGGGTHSMFASKPRNGKWSPTHGHWTPIEGEWSPSTGPGSSNYMPPMDLITNGGMLLMSNIVGCKVYKGHYNGIMGKGGCCKQMDISALESELMAANHAYYINALGIHESLKIEGPVNRAIIRINFHHDYKWKPIS